MILVISWASIGNGVLHTSFPACLRGYSMSTEKITEVLKRHTDELMSVPGVVGVAEGEFQGSPCIKVFVMDKTQELLRQIPETIEGFLLQIEESGEFRTLGT